MQQGFDFETPLPGHDLPPKPSARELRRLTWEALGHAPAPSGEPSGETCSQCHQPILVDDEFAEKFGEHVECFAS